MKQLFKTSLVAAAVAACGTAFAGDLSVQTSVHSKEGLSGISGAVTANDIMYKLGAPYAVGDRITFTFTEGSVNESSFPLELNVPAVNNADSSKAIAGLALGRIRQNDTAATYRVTSLSQPTDGAGTSYTDRTTTNAVVTLSGVEYKAENLKNNGSVALTVTAVDNLGDAMDEKDTNGNTPAGVVAKADSQYDVVSIASSDRFDGVIDVASARNSFANGMTDTLMYAAAKKDTTGWKNLATTDKLTINLYGEAGSMTGITKDMFSTVETSTRTFDADAAMLAVSYNGMITNDTLTFTPPTGSNVINLEPQNFTADAVYSYTASDGKSTGTKTVSSGMNAGAWTLNGAVVNVPYMPYSANASQILYVTNASDQIGDILVTAFDDKGNSYDLGKVGTANGKTVTKITAQVFQALQAKGFEAGKVSLTVTVNAPKKDVTVYASYNAGTVRGFVNTDQYKGSQNYQ